MLQKTLSNFLAVILMAFSISILLSSCSYSSKTAARMYNKVKGQQFDVVVVPGVPLEDGNWNRTMKGRIYWAKFLYDKGIAKNVMFSGGAVYTPYIEAEVMALYAEAIGIPHEHIYTETKAEHSTENIFYSYKKAKKLGFNSVALASDPFQSKLLSAFARKKIDRSIAIIPMLTDTLNVMEPTMLDPKIDYQKAAYLGNFVPITEREGFWKRLRGTFGSNVKPDIYE